MIWKSLIPYYQLITMPNIWALRSLYISEHHSVLRTSGLSAYTTAWCILIARGTTQIHPKQLISVRQHPVVLASSDLLLQGISGGAILCLQLIRIKHKPIKKQHLSYQEGHRYLLHTHSLTFHLNRRAQRQPDCTVVQFLAPSAVIPVKPEL